MGRIDSGAERPQFSSLSQPAKLCDREVILKLNGTKTPTLLTEFCCMAAVKSRLKLSCYENNHTHCGVLP